MCKFNNPKAARSKLFLYHRIRVDKQLTVDFYTRKNCSKAYTDRFRIINASRLRIQLAQERKPLIRLTTSFSRLGTHLIWPVVRLVFEFSCSSYFNYLFFFFKFCSLAQNLFHCLFAFCQSHRIGFTHELSR